jgi:CRP/FNR family transcriptional regulator
MLKNRHHLNVHCKTCSVAHLCIVRGSNNEEIEKVNNIINKLFILAPGEHLYYQNQKTHYIFALYSGFCKEYSVDEEGSEIVSGFYFPGDILGLESFQEKKYLFSAIALKPCQFCAIPCQELFQLMREYPHIFERFIHIMSHKTHNNYQSHFTTNAKHRIAVFLLDIFYRIQERKKSEGYIDLPMSQFDIGNLLGLAHETVSRILHLFQQSHIIKIQNRSIYITDIAALKTLAHYDH